MKEYIYSCAIDALELLASEKPLKDRLSFAWSKLGLCDSEIYIQDSTDIRAAFKETEHAMLEGDLSSQSAAIRSLIYQIIFEAGYSKAVSELKS